MTDIKDLSAYMKIIQCYTCNQVSIDGAWANHVIPERAKDNVLKDYCPKCDDAQRKLMEVYDRRPKRKIIGMATIAI